MTARLTRGPRANPPPAVTADRQRHAKELAYLGCAGALGYGLMKVDWALGGTVGLRNPKHGEEAEGHLDNLLARHLNRGTWVAGRLGFGVALVVAIGLAVAVGGWIGVASRNSGVGFSTMLEGGLNMMPAALFVLGLGTLLYGLMPRIAAPLLYALVLWSFLIEIIGSSITSNRLLLDTALFSHLGPVPASSLNWTAIAVLTGLGLIAAFAGLAAFQRRDLAAA